MACRRGTCDSQSGFGQPSRLRRGCSTASPVNLDYRLGKLAERGLLRGDWLDCGCASGEYAAAMVRYGVDRVVGIDVEEARISQAREKYGNIRNAWFCTASSEAMPFPDGAFDGVLLNEVLEHVRDEACTLREIYRVLRPGGHLALMSPNRWFPFEGHVIAIGAWSVPAPIPLLPWLPRKLSQPVMVARNYWPNELRDLVLRCGFEVVCSRSIFPTLEIYRWLPARIARRYRRAVPLIERTPLINRFGVSTFILAARPA